MEKQLKDFFIEKWKKLEKASGFCRTIIEKAAEICLIYKKKNSKIRGAWKEDSGERDRNLVPELTDTAWVGFDGRYIIEGRGNRGGFRRLKEMRGSERIKGRD